MAIPKSDPHLTPLTPPPPPRPQNFLNEAVAASTEGLIVKTMEDVYQVGRGAGR
jgi:hypothetical protein